MIVTDRNLIGPWVAGKMFGTWNPHSQCIGLVHDHSIMAGVTYDNWNGVSVHASIAVDGMLTPGFLAAIFHYPFIFLGAKKVICTVAEGNEESVNLVEKMGFRKEAQLLDAHPDGSLLIYTLNRENCRFIGDRYVKKLKLH